MALFFLKKKIKKKKRKKKFSSTPCVAHMSCSFTAEITPEQFAFYMNGLTVHSRTLKVLQSNLEKVTKDQVDTIQETATLADNIVQESMRILRNVAVDDSAYNFLVARIARLLEEAQTVTKKIAELRQ